MTIQYHKPPFLLNELKLEVTHACPMACIHCSSEASPSTGREMSLSKALQIADQAIEIGVKKVDISGGEPLLWAGLLDLVCRICSAGAHVSLYTTGCVEKFDGMLERLIDAGASRLIFSLFAASHPIHERVTRKTGSFQLTVQAIQKTVAAGAAAELHFVPMAFNYDELPPLVSLAKDLGVKRISVLRFVSQGRGALIPEFALTKQQNVRLKRLVEVSRRSMQIRAGSPYNFLLINESPECCAGIDRLSVGPDYDVYPCDAFKQIKARDLVPGDEHSNLGRHCLADCWHHSAYLSAVRNYLTTDFSESCRSCALLTRCLSGCLAQKVLRNGDFRKDVDPMCIFSKDL